MPQKHEKNILRMLFPTAPQPVNNEPSIIFKTWWLDMKHMKD